jgi:hypothetical protein
MSQDPKQKPAHTAPSKPTPPPAGKPAQPHQAPQHQPGAPAPKFTDPKKK